MDVDHILEEVSGDCFWVPEHVQVVERAGIKYTHSPDPSAIYNRVLRVRPEERDPEELIAEVLGAHRGCASLWMLTTMSDTPGLRKLLEAAGYEAGNEHHAYSITTGAYDRTVSDVEVREVATCDDLRLLYQINADVFQKSTENSEGQLQRELRHCTGPNRRVARFIAYRGGEPAGTGGLTFFDDMSFALVWAGGVREEHRGYGVYTALLAARAQEAAARGIERMGLYARVNTSGPIVAAHGFEQHGHMVYFERPPEQ